LVRPTSMQRSPRDSGGDASSCSSRSNSAKQHQKPLDRS
jgi:hypothetical protein